MTTWRLEQLSPYEYLLYIGKHEHLYVLDTRDRATIENICDQWAQAVDR